MRTQLCELPFYTKSWRIEREIIIGKMSSVKANIILVEDDKSIRAAVKRALKKAGHNVLFDAADWRTADQKIDNLRIHPDVTLGR